MEAPESAMGQVWTDISVLNPQSSERTETSEKQKSCALVAAYHQSIKQRRFHCP